MDARQLRYFIAVVENGGVTRASEALFVSQPSLSQTIKTLERDLGAALFEKHGRGLRLTPAGQVLIGPARAVRDALLDATEAIQRVEQLQVGRLDLAVTDEVVFDPLVSIIARFQQRFPDIVVNVLPATDAESAAAQLRSAECEIALCALPSATAGLQAVPLERRTLALVLPPGYDAPRADPVPLARLSDVPLVAAPVGEVVRDQVDRAAAEAGTAFRYAVECSSLDALPYLVLNGAGAAFLPSAVAEELATAGAIVRRTKPTLTQQVGFLSRKDSLSAASRSFVLTAQRVMARRQPSDEGVHLPLEPSEDLSGGPTQPPASVAPSVDEGR